MHKKNSVSNQLFYPPLVRTSNIIKMYILVSARYYNNKKSFFFFSTSNNNTTNNKEKCIGILTAAGYDKVERMEKRI